MHHLDPFPIQSATLAKFRRISLVALAFGVSAVSAQSPRPVVLRLDLLDVDGGGRWNQRHLQHWKKRTVVCCADLAWMPVQPKDGPMQVGGSLNLGGWVEDLSVGPHVWVLDALLAGSARWTLGREGVLPWARLDLGPALLVVERRQVGLDWGVGASFQAGLAFPQTSADLLLGAGVDIRRYQHLEVEDLPAMTVSVGVGL